jgi:CRISPR/Cas system-associated exonuclease Cas4 (RecB family)
MTDFLMSQSMIKDLIKYKEGSLCGLVFQQKWHTGVFGTPSRANRLGQYFEWLATGALPHDKKTPEPEYKKDRTLATDFEIARNQAIYFKRLIANWDIKIYGTQVNLTVQDKWTGDLDIIVKWEGLKDILLEMKYPYEHDPRNNEHFAIIDLKFTALLEDKWNELGWNIDMLPKKFNTIFQATHYVFLWKKKNGYKIPFLFWVFDAKEEGNMKPILIAVSDEDLEAHEEFLNKSRIYYQQKLKEGFDPLPSYKRCRECSFNQWCQFKVTTPEINIVIPEI